MSATPENNDSSDQFLSGYSDESGFVAFGTSEDTPGLEQGGAETQPDQSITHKDIIITPGRVIRTGAGRDIFSQIDLKYYAPTDQMGTIGTTDIKSSLYNYAEKISSTDVPVLALGGSWGNTVYAPTATWGSYSVTAISINAATGQGTGLYFRPATGEIDAALYNRLGIAIGTSSSATITLTAYPSVTPGVAPTRGVQAIFNTNFTVDATGTAEVTLALQGATNTQFNLVSSATTQNVLSTGTTTFAAGDLYYSSGASFGALSALAKGSQGGVLYAGASAPVYTSAGTSSQVLLGGTTPSWGAVDLASMVTGTTPVANGGTGTGSLTQYGVAYGDGTNYLKVTAVGTDGQFLIGTTSNAPKFVTMSGDITILNTGLATITASAVTANKIASSAVTTAKIANDAVTYAKIQTVTGSSIIGNTATTTTNVAAITAGTDGHVLRRSSGVLGFGTIDLGSTSTFTGTTPVANGGTGTGSLTQYGLLYGDGTNYIKVTAVGTDGQFLIGTTSSAPKFVSMAGDVVITNTGLATIQSNVVTYAKFQTVTGSSVIGNTASTTSTAGAITAGTDGHVLRRSSGVLGFGLIDLANTSTVSGLLAITNGGTGSNTGSITGASALTFAAGGTNQNITLDPSGTGTVDVSNARITNVASPTASTDAVNRAYVDSVASGLDLKASVRAATTASITLSGEQTIDTVAVVAGDRVLVKNQGGTPSSSANGIYVVSASAWSRATDADENSEVTTGLFTFVEEGTTNGDTGWVLTTNNPIAVGTTALAFTQFSGAGNYSAQAPITLVGSVFGLDTPLAVQYGGIGTASLTQYGVTYGDNTSFLKAMAVGTDGQFLVGVSNNAPKFVTMSGDVSISNAGTATIANSAVTTAKISDGNVTFAKIQNIAGSSIFGNTSTTAGTGGTITATADGHVLRRASGVLGFGTIDLGNTSTVTGTLGVTNGGTGTGSYSAGDLLYATGASALARLSVGASGTILSSSGSAPQWSTTSTLGLLTGTSTATYVAYYSGASTLTGSSNFAYNGLQLQLSNATSSGGILIGGDAQLYRGAADRLQTPDSVRIDAQLGIGADPNASYSITTSGDINVATGAGFLINGGATSGNVLRGNGTRFVSSQLAFSDLSGTASVSQGGTGTGSLTQYGVAYGDGTNYLKVTAVGTDGQFLIGTTSNAPKFVTMAGDVVITNTGLATIQANAVTTTKISNSNVTFAKIQNIAGSSIFGNTSTTAGVGGTITAGTDGHVLRRSSGVLGFGTIDLGNTSTVTGTTGVANGGTGTGSYSAGDLLYATGASTLARLSVGVSNTILSSSGTAPQWSSLTTLGLLTGTTGTQYRIALFDTTSSLANSLIFQDASSSPTTVAISSTGTAGGTQFYAVQNIGGGTPTQATGQSVIKVGGTVSTTLSPLASTLNIVPTVTQDAQNVAVFAITNTTGVDVRAMFDGKGNLRANSKSFDIPHPTKPGKRLVYGVLEGPEHGVYHRGSTEGRGKVRVDLPEYWSALTHPGYTAAIAPLGNYGCYIASKDESGFEVCRAGVFGKWLPLAFEFMVIGSRRDVDLEMEPDV